MAGNLYRASLDDLLDARKMRGKLSHHMGSPLTTTRSADPNSKPFDLTMFNLSEILMRIPAIESPQKIMGLLEELMSGQVGSILDDIREAGLGAIIPDDIQMEFDLYGSDVDTDYIGYLRSILGGGSDGGSGGTIGGSASVQKLLSVALGEVGYQGSGPSNNTNKYAGDVGHGNGAPWCSTFVTWCFWKAGMPQEEMNAATYSSFGKYESKGQTGSQPQPGAIVFYHFGRTSERTDHNGIVIDGDSSEIHTVEGNTSGSGAGSQSNGGMVAEKNRGTDSVVGYAYPDYPSSSDAAAGESGSDEGSSAGGGGAGGGGGAYSDSDRVTPDAGTAPGSNVVPRR